MVSFFKRRLSDREMLTEEQKKKIQDKLTEKQALQACPRCGNLQFTLLDGVFSNTVLDNYKSLKLGGNILPTVVVICNKCGYLSEHSLIVLGLADLFQ